MSLKKRYDVNQTAKALGINPNTVRELCRSGQLRAKNIRPNSVRARWQIFEDDINAFGESNDIVAVRQKLMSRHPDARADIVALFKRLDEKYTPTPMKTVTTAREVIAHG
jgi:hypothetical protein